MERERSLISKVLLFASVALLIISWSAKSYGYEWWKTFGGNGEQTGHSVQQTTPDGGYILVGHTEALGAGKSDVYLIKTDADGNELWSKTFGGDDLDYGYSVQQTSDEGYIITGVTHSFGAGASDVYLIKTDADGNELWSKTFGGDDLDYGYSVQQTSDGGYIIAGRTNSFGANFGEVYLIKTDADGNEEWSKTFGEFGGTDAGGSSALETSDGDYIIVGYSYGYGQSQSDVWLIKTDRNGNLLWSRLFGGDRNDRGSSVKETADDGYIIAGFTWSFAASHSDVYLIKTDYFGNEQWSKTFEGKGLDWGKSVHQTKDGGYIIAGSTEEWIPYARDVYLIKTDADGNLLWSRTFGRGDVDEDAHSVQETIDGGYIIAGHSGTLVAGGGGNADAILIYYNPNPVPDIKASGSDGPITIPHGENLTITVALDPGDYDGEDADWWVAAEAPFGLYWYTLDQGWVRSDAPIRAYADSLFDLSPFEVLNISGLPVRAYTFYFGVDLLMNGFLDFGQLYYDSVDVTIE